MRTPMMIQGASTLLNVALDPLFMFTFGWGVRGAAIATVVSQAAAAIAFVWLVWRKGRSLRHASIPGTSGSAPRRDGRHRAHRRSRLALVPAARGRRRALQPDPGRVLAGQRRRLSGRRPTRLRRAAADDLDLDRVGDAGQHVPRRTAPRPGARRGALRDALGDRHRRRGRRSSSSRSRPGWCKGFSSEPGIVAAGTAYLRIIAWSYPFVAFSMLAGRILQGLGIGTPVLVLTVMRVLLIAVPLSWVMVYWWQPGRMACGARSSSAAWSPRWSRWCGCGSGSPAPNGARCRAARWRTQPTRAPPPLKSADRAPATTGLDSRKSACQPQIATRATTSSSSAPATRRCARRSRRARAARGWPCSSAPPSASTAATVASPWPRCDSPTTASTN